MELFYTPPENISGQQITLDDFEKKHILQTLRKSSGATIYVTDGAGRLFTTTLLTEKPQAVLQISSEQKMPLPDAQLELAIGFIRPARLEFVFEKGTELGVRVFHLLPTLHANYASNNVTRYQKILRQAIKQSQQYYLPKIHTYRSFDDFLNTGFDGMCRIAAIDSGFPSIIKKIQPAISEKCTSFLYIVGPEGGFASDETEKLSAAGFEPVSLGPNRLRAETAAISGISCIQQYIYQ